MNENILLAVDLGTSFIKVGAYDDTSACVALEMEPVKDYRPGPGIFIQKGDELVDSVVKCLCKVAERLGDRRNAVAAIAFTGQMSGFMGVDKEWNDITTWSCSLDSRYMPYAKKQMESLGEKFLCIGGTNFPQMAPKYEWFREEFPQESKKIEKYLMISGYVIGKLGDISVEDSVMDRSYIQWTGLADVNHDRWSEEICREIGLDLKYLPKIVNSNYVCACLNKKIAELTGLTQGIPLVSGAGDKAAGCLGAAIVDYGDTIFEASSYGEISCCVPEYRADIIEKRLDVIPSAVPGDFYTTHFVAGSGITLDWFIDQFVRESGKSSKESFALMEEKMRDIEPGCSGVMAIGLLGGSSMPLDGSLRGMFMGFDWSHGPEHFYKALLESFTYDFSLAFDRIEQLYPEYDIQDVKIIGGGAKSPVWTQMCADVQNKTYYTLDREDVAMWGAAMLAGNAVGIFEDLKETARRYVNKRNRYTSNSAKGKEYGKYKQIYKEYTKDLHDVFEKHQRL